MIANRDSNFPPQEFCLLKCEHMRDIDHSKLVAGVKHDPKVVQAYESSIQRMRKEYCLSCLAAQYHNYRRG